ncbi:MAG: carbohydrate-binding protein, partial [Planctomycetota bacterium]|nr:carbohydrate-binding protein [Planctomycetota bacterium]
MYEARWLRQPRIARDYARYWFRTPGAQPRNYSTWLADGMWATQEVHPDDAFTTDLLNDLILNYEGWEQRQFVPEVGLFWQNGHDDGMEFNINSRQTKDILRGAPGFRPSFNAYMWADAQAIARIADLRGDRESREIAKRFRSKADRLKERLQALLWDPERQFFFPMYRDDEERDGHKVKARTLTYQSGQFAGDAHGRELIGYVPWQFNMLDTDKGFEKAWGKLMDREAFFADFGPTTVERHDPMFLLQKSCCWWSGQSWPYATSQTLKGMANLLHNQQQSVVSAADYVRMLQIYSRSHRKGGRPYLAEACHPDTG